MLAKEKDDIGGRAGEADALEGLKGFWGLCSVGRGLTRTGCAMAAVGHDVVRKIVS